MDGLEKAKALKIEDVYKSYQQRGRVSEELQMEILRGAREGEDPCILLLKATRAISLMTGSDTFADQIERLLRGVYGEALGYKAPLALEIEEVKDRIAHIEKAMQSTENDQLRAAMDLSLRSHTLRLHRLEEAQRESDSEKSKTAEGDKEEAE